MSAALTDRISDVVADSLRTRFDDNGDDGLDEFAAHVAEQVAAVVCSWDGLMVLLDEQYPEDVFPTLEDRADRDTGPRIVSLIRQIHQLRQEAS